MNYKLSKTARIYKNKNTNIISTGTSQFFVNNDEYYKILNLLNFLKEEKSKSEFLDFISKNKISDEIINKLIDSNMITTNTLVFEKKDTIEFKNNLYLDVMFNKSYEIHNKISQQTFLIIGAGGIGNYISYGLNSFNPKKIVLIDGDKIEFSNLNRQFLFTISDIGEDKTTTLKRELEYRNKDTNIEYVSKYCDYSLLEELIKKNETNNIIMIVSADSDKILEDVTRISVKYKIPFLNVGYLNDISVIGPFFIPGISSCPYCNSAYGLENCKDSIESPLFKDIYNYINSNSTAPSYFVNNALASSMALVDIFGYLSGDYSKINSLNKRLGISNRNFEKLEISNTIDKNCKYCSKVNYND
ncbi:ThiF family adenylyltransferase [Gemella haemolysans]|uniref:ThiF family adenylyltransferase n=1 Tax=Gemella haemolysans TaxID=1379 RepID=UPI00232BAE8B|nr:ThiF family adenylyltransferase [Gemella haemolysans]MDB6213910.1 ThiF family adenylyltransferase [Gemella haemolysans]